jgi:hypothetical protein
MPLKWIYKELSQELLALYHQCAVLGHQPTVWRDACVSMLKKPNKKDTSTPRSYRPITLEETFGKLLEKMMVTQLQYWAAACGWISDSQYGGRKGRSVYDAVEVLLTDINDTLDNHKAYTLFAMDIQGYFDNIRHVDIQNRLLEVNAPDPLCKWIMSFVANCRAAISFDGYTGPLLPKPDLGIPQGSPLSPILSVFTTSNVLKIFDQPSAQPVAKMFAYMDDHVVGIATRDTATTAQQAAVCYKRVRDEFSKYKIEMEPTKNEVMHFIWVSGIAIQRKEGETGAQANKRRRHEVQTTPVVIKITNTQGQGQSDIVVKPSTLLRWLGIYFDYLLHFSDHVTRMANKARSTIAAMKLLANTTRGMSAAHLHSLYQGAVEPIMMWGLPAWYKGQNHCQKTKIVQLERVQNEALRWIAGAWRTSPIEPLRVLLGIPPVDLKIERNMTRIAERTQRRATRRLGYPRHGEVQTRAVRVDKELRKRLIKDMERLDPFEYPPWTIVAESHPLNNRISFASASAGTRDGQKAVADAVNRASLDRPNFSTLFIFTDGSRRGCHLSQFAGGCAYVVFREGEETEEGK